MRENITADQAVIAAPSTSRRSGFPVVSGNEKPPTATRRLRGDAESEPEPPALSAPELRVLASLLTRLGVGRGDVLSLLAARGITDEQIAAADVASCVRES